MTCITAVSSPTPHLPRSSRTDYGDYNRLFRTPNLPSLRASEILRSPNNHHAQPGRDLAGQLHGHGRCEQAHARGKGRGEQWWDTC